MPGLSGKTALALLAFGVGPVPSADAQPTKANNWPPLLICDTPKGESFYSDAFGKSPLSPDSGWHRDDGLWVTSLALVKGERGDFDIVFTNKDGKKDTAKAWGDVTPLYGNATTVILLTSNLYRDGFVLWTFTKGAGNEFSLMRSETFAGVASAMAPSASLFVAKCR